MIAARSTGFDHIDIKECRKRKETHIIIRVFGRTRNAHKIKQLPGFLHFTGYFIFWIPYCSPVGLSPLRPFSPLVPLIPNT